MQFQDLGKHLISSFKHPNEIGTIPFVYRRKARSEMGSVFPALLLSVNHTQVFLTAA